GGIWGLAILLGGLLVNRSNYYSPLNTELNLATSPAPGISESNLLSMDGGTPTAFPIVYTLMTRVPPDLNAPSTLTPTVLPFYEGPIYAGKSIGGRPIEVFRLGNGPKAYMLVGGIHGGYEIITSYLIDEIIEYFIWHPAEIPSDTRLYLLRSLNPDGAQLPYDADGRPNLNGVDLNRNYTEDWAAAWPREGCWDFRPTHGGTHPASEPETVALMSFVLEHPLIALVSYHAVAPGFYPAGDPLDPKSHKLSKDLSDASGYPYPAVETGCKMTGSLVDWVITTGAAAVDVELTSHRETDFEINLKLVKALLGWLP
ncbi:MAG: M14 family metallopeptidase, partial [Chloroflexota bacterium]